MYLLFEFLAINLVADILPIAIYGETLFALIAAVVLAFTFPGITL